MKTIGLFKFKFLFFYIFSAIILLNLLPIYPAITDDGTNLIIPFGESYAKSGKHSYQSNVVIAGTLNVITYDSTPNSGFLELEAKTVTISGTLNANSKGYSKTYPSTADGTIFAWNANGISGAGGGGYYQSGHTIMPFRSSSGGAYVNTGGKGGGMGGAGGKGEFISVEPPNTISFHWSDKGAAGMYSKIENALHMGRAGGYTNGTGGKGAGYIILKCNDFLITSTGKIQVNGGNGDNTGSGGGSGGGLYIKAENEIYCEAESEVYAVGGRGGNAAWASGRAGGGGGSGGLVIMQTFGTITMPFVSNGFVDVSGGEGGAGDGNSWNCGYGGGGGGGVIQIIIPDIAGKNIINENSKLIVSGGTTDTKLGDPKELAQPGAIGVRETTLLCPKINTVAPGYGIPGTTIITLNGQNFGAVRGNSAITFFDTPLTNDTDYLLWSDTTIQLVVLSNVAYDTGTISIELESSCTLRTPYYIPGNEVSFTTLPHVIYNISHTAADIGTEITLSGQNFGDAQISSKIMLNGIELGTASFWSDSLIKFTVQQGHTSGPLLIKKGGIDCNSFNFSVGIPPLIAYASPDKADIGDLVVIVGTGFGEAQGFSKVLFNEVEVGVAKLWSSSRIEIFVPGTATNGILKVVKYGIDSNPVNFIVGAKPLIDTIAPASAPNIGIINIQVTGDNFLAGTTAKLIKTGYPVIPASLVSIKTVRKIECLFPLDGVYDGLYTLVIASPDGVEASLLNGFSIFSVGAEKAGVMVSATHFQMDVQESITLVYNIEQSKSSSTEVIIYGLAGKPIRTYNSDTPVGSINWDGKDDNGEPVNSGVYLVKIYSGQHEENYRIMVTR